MNNMRSLLLFSLCLGVLVSGYLGSNNPNESSLEDLLRKTLDLLEKRGGAVTAEEVKWAYYELSDHEYSWIILKVMDDKRVELDDKAKGSPEEFINRLAAERDCRCAIYRFPHEWNTYGRPQLTVVVFWSPDVCPLKKRLLYNTAIDTVMRDLQQNIKVVADSKNEIQPNIIQALKNNG